MYMEGKLLMAPQQRSPCSRKYMPIISTIEIQCISLPEEVRENRTQTLNSQGRITGDAEGWASVLERGRGAIDYDGDE